MAEKIQNYTGIYVHGINEAAFYTILLPDNTCGMFLMPSAQDVFWMGFTTYKVEGNKLFFKVQNVNPDAKPVEPPKKQKAGANEKGEEQFLEATLTVGKEYIQHGRNQDTKFLFLTDDLKFWKDYGWKKIGEARHLESMGDFDVAHEIRKLSAMVINKYGPVFIWA